MGSRNSHWRNNDCAGGFEYARVDKHLFIDTFGAGFLLRKVMPVTGK